MYPQSLQTHSPCQYCASFASSSAFCAAVFFFPKTMFRLEADSVPLETEVDNLGPVNAVDELNRQHNAMKAKTNLIKALIFEFSPFTYGDKLVNGDLNTLVSSIWFCRNDPLY